MSKHATEKLTIVVTPDSEVLEVLTDKEGSLTEVYISDGSPVVTSMEVVADLDRFAEVEANFQAAMDAAGCQC